MKTKSVTSFLLSIVLLLSLCFAPVHGIESGKQSITYSDVPASHWAYEAIADMTSRGMFNGTSISESGVATFSPGAEMTRAQFVAVLTRYLYGTSLAEMEPGAQWYTNNYILALRFGLLTAEELDGGVLTVPCTRQEMAMMLVRAAYQGAGETADPSIEAASIPDYGKVQEYYRSYVLQAYSMGLLAGVDSEGTFSPDGHLNRAQAAMVIYRLLDPSARVEIHRSDESSFTWRDGISYAGQIRDGEANGYGKMVFPDIGTYVGYFVNGKREGLGTFSWLVGDSYVGTWSADKMNGSGTYTFSDGYTIRGLWQDNQIAIDSLYMMPSSVVTVVGATEYLVAMVEPGQVTEVIEWNSSNSQVVKAVGNGNLCTLTAKSVGTAVVTAKTASGKKTTCEITVKQPERRVQSIKLNYGDYRAEIGEEVQLKAELTLEPDANTTVTWGSSNPAVASVSATGTVKAKARGISVISAKTSTGLIASCYFTVEDPDYELWSGSWNVYTASASGNRSSNTVLGTCTINLISMTAYFSMAPFTGKYIDLNPTMSYEMSGLLEAGTNAYEVTFTSIRDDLVIVEAKKIVDNQYYSDTVSVTYYTLER